jgi:beta-1,4-mannosyl-glycoprotein beta-1,4-N-acetylglucosaminyltransferase
MYFDEDVMLDLRLHTLNEYVDTFVIAEATRDHAGKEKKLNFDYKNFLKFKNKIKYLIIDDLPISVKSKKKKLGTQSFERPTSEEFFNKGI